MIDAALTQRRIMRCDFSAALSGYAYAKSTPELYDKADKFLEDFVHLKHWTLIERTRAGISSSDQARRSTTSSRGT